MRSTGETIHDVPSKMFSKNWMKLADGGNSGAVLTDTETLSVQYEQATGKAPSSRMSKKAMIAAIQKAQNEKA